MLRIVRVRFKVLFVVSWFLSAMAVAIFVRNFLPSEIAFLSWYFVGVAFWICGVRAFRGGSKMVGSAG